MRQIDIESRLMYNNELLREAEQNRLLNQAKFTRSKRAGTIYIPISPRTFTRRLYKSFVIWLAGIFPELACHYNWVPCDN